MVMALHLPPSFFSSKLMAVYNIDSRKLTTIWTSAGDDMQRIAYEYHKNRQWWALEIASVTSAPRVPQSNKSHQWLLPFLRRRQRRWLPDNVTGNDLLSNQSPVPMVRSSFPYSRWSSLHQLLTIIGLLRWHRRSVMDTRRRRQRYYQRPLKVDIYIHYPSIKSHCLFQTVCHQLIILIYLVYPVNLSCFYLVNGRCLSLNSQSLFSSKLVNNNEITLMFSFSMQPLQLEIQIAISDLSSFYRQRNSSFISWPWKIVHLNTFHSFRWQ